ncbi:50S ribosomal protein L10 [Candidatus Pacearchaeota archaeon ex4484_71]|nr:MAG: 50S ribosomal protein L10 [Candidatus Pacearchaeota archaeon ex4484_71]
MKPKAVSNIPSKKLEMVKDLKNLFSNKKTILISSIKNIPASQFQEISKKLRGKALVRVPKKSLLFRAIEETKNQKIIDLKENIDESFALLFSDLDSFDLASELIKNKTPARAKAGQEAPTDIEIPAGPTDLVPGPAISELGALGIQIQIKDGKIEIKEPKVIAKEGEKISQGAAEIMGKLDIKPFSIGFSPLVALDLEKNVLYTEINIDEEKAVSDLKEAFARAVPFAVEVGYSCEDTIRFLLGKAGLHEKIIENLSKEEKLEEEKKEETKEEKEETQTPTENEDEQKSSDGEEK